MLKARNKKVSLILVLAMMMTMFAGLGAASATDVTYSVMGGGSIRTDAAPQNIGTIVVSIPEVRLLPVYTTGAGEYLSVSLPEGVAFKMPAYDADYKANMLASAASKVDQTGKIKLVAPYAANISSDGRTLNMLVGRVAGEDGSDQLIIKLDDVIVQDAAGDINVLIGGPAGSLFPQSQKLIGKTVSSGSTSSFVKSVKTFGDSGSIDDIIIMENSNNTFKTSDTVELTLPNGFSWDSAATVTVKGDWSLAGYELTGTAIDIEGRNLSFDLADRLVGGVVTMPAVSRDKGARLVISGLKIKSEENAKTGDITVEVDGDITAQSIVVAKLGDYGVTVSEESQKDLVAGQTDQKLGNFYIEEQILNSLVRGRTVTFELPTGVKWTKTPTITAKKGDAALLHYESITNKNRTLKYTIPTGNTSAMAKLLIEEGKVYIEPGFEGPIEIKVSGTAGAEGTVKVANVSPAVKLEAAGVANVVVGQQAQKVADILIKEGAKGAILKDGDHDTIIVSLDSGFKFSQKPVVTVSEGDLEIDSVKLNSSNELLTLKVKYDSTKASTIKISDVYLTGFRSAPAGQVKAYLVEAEGEVGDSKATGSTALDDGFLEIGAGTGVVAEFSETSAGNVVIATCVTPAEGSGNVSFKVNSNIYYLNGVARVMDVAPYIKNARTYTPMRYIAESLGAEVVWDAAAQTVTLKKADATVVFTIGSTSYTVNGEAKTMDVAPEINNDRTMLPARFVAEAFGATVGWDAATGTVLIQ